MEYSLKKFNHANIRVEYVCLLRPTSPFRTKNFIKDGLQKLLKNSKACSLRAVKKCSEHPGKMWILQKNIIYPLLPFSNKNVPWHSMHKSLPDIYIQTASLEVLNVKKTISKNLLAGEINIPHFGSDLDNFDINNQSDLES